MTIRNIRWADAAHSRIYCETDEVVQGEMIPMVVSVDYDTAIGRALFQHIASGSAGSIAAYIAPPVQLPAIPSSVTALQGLLAIDAAGLAQAYTEWANAPERTFAQKAFIDKAQVWKRNDPTLAAAATDLGLTSEQVDLMFLTASTL